MNSSMVEKAAHLVIHGDGARQSEGFMAGQFTRFFVGFVV
jgi:hypothetical protein